MQSDNKPEEKNESYKCNTPGCKNVIFWNKKKEELFIKNGWVDQSGRPTKPRYCKDCREERRARQ